AYAVSRPGGAVPVGPPSELRGGAPGLRSERGPPPRVDGGDPRLDRPVRSLPAPDCLRGAGTDDGAARLRGVHGTYGGALATPRVRLGSRRPPVRLAGGQCVTRATRGQSVATGQPDGAWRDAGIARS